MLRKLALPALLCTSLMLQAPVALSEESSAATGIPQQTLLDYLAGKAEFTLIDARSAEEYEAGHIWNASSVPFDSDLAASEALPDDLSRPLVVYCKSGKRAEALQSSLREMGYTDVRVLYPAQMLWAGELPVFNCGATASAGTGLVTATEGGSQP